MTRGHVFTTADVSDDKRLLQYKLIYLQSYEHDMVKNLTMFIRAFLFSIFHCLKMIKTKRALYIGAGATYRWNICTICSTYTQNVLLDDKQLLPSHHSWDSSRDRVQIRWVSVAGIMRHPCTQESSSNQPGATKEGQHVISVFKTTLTVKARVLWQQPDPNEIHFPFIYLVCTQEDEKWPPFCK